MKTKLLQKNQEYGFIALISILLVGSLTLFIALGLSFSALSGIDASLGQESAYIARSRAESCAEYALLKIRDNNEYLGGEQVVLMDGTCVVESVASGENGSKDIYANASMGDYERRVYVTASTSPIFKVVGWRDIE